ncbi:MAG: uroporphyrinogen decarboxylase family protein [Kiritimatiellae bacterium]|nr:uroporphyrinogen decarboxylase family protein [Kiritimatiellia bacterium]
MTDTQWTTLCDVIDGKAIAPLPVGFIIDSPWLPNWAGMTIRDYFEDDAKWLEANLKAIREFPDIIFLPGFWSEYGMCTEPSAFGSECTWHDNELPFAEKIIDNVEQVNELNVPDPSKDGLCPKVIDRLKKHKAVINAEGHEIKFAISRGPLNLASFLMGNTEFLMAMYTDPDACKKLLEIITEFTVNWIRHQKETFPSIDGIFILDDIVGFIGEDDFRSYALPYLKTIYGAFDAKIKFFHNDAPGKVCAPFLPEIGINLFNFAFEHSLPEMKDWTGNTVTLLGNIPPRDVLARGNKDDVRESVNNSLNSIDDQTRVILSCGGGMPPEVSTQNIKAFCIETGQSR